MNKILFVVMFLFGFCFTIGYLSHGSKAQGLDTSLPTPHRDIYLIGDVNEAMAFKIREEIAGLNEQGTGEITLHITSPGGEVYAGIQIYDYMMESKAPIRTSCEGMCMSMAAYLLASGTTRQSSAHASIMFHQVSSESKGHLNDMLADLAETQRLQNILNEMVGKRSGLTGEQLNKIEDHDNFMSPQEAKRLNLIDTIVGEK